MDQSGINDLVSELAQRLRNKQKFGAPITDSYIEVTVNNLVLELSELPNFTISDEEVEILKFKLGSMFNIKVGEIAITLHNPEIARWFDSRKSEIDWKYWNAYKAMLISQARPIDVIDENELVIDKILDFSGDPTGQGPWARKGLVMGNVQSGKTQNYLGLVNKAIDCGYKVIILLGGHLNDLRKQTQERVDEGVIGRESKHLVNIRRTRPEPIGVGNFRDDAINVHTFTTTAGDFTKSFASSLGVNLTGLSEPAIFTVKKNTSVMQSLFEWIRDHHYLNPENHVKLDLPMLIIDDEADYASVNTKAHKEEVTKTNEYIRKLISLFNRSTYVGYTATPFANIFIDPETEDDVINDDLFPSDFMVKIPVPENYRGQDFYFAKKTSSTVLISDHGSLVGLKSEDVINDIPGSLKDAMRTFFLAIAIRYLRGEKNSHNTMLVNISHLKVHQDRLEFLLREYRKEVLSSLDSFSGLGVVESRKSKILKTLEDSFKINFSVSEKYADIFELLPKVADKVQVWAINQGNNTQVLDYSVFEENGLCAIVIGGHKLSRGLTLQGLSVSYFTRNSKAYDTLMQMCRWFGYRPRYEDLCRVYLPFESFSWYSFISNAIKELYSELDQMSKAEKRPREFGLKVRDHPGAMIITAKNKMTTAKTEVRSQELWGQVLRRFRFRADKDVNQRNINYAESFLREAVENRNSEEVIFVENSGSFIIKDVSYSAVIKFIQNIDLPEDEVGNTALINHLREMDRAELPAVSVGLFNVSKYKKNPWEKNLTDDERAFINTEYEFWGKKLRLPKRIMKSDTRIYSYPSVQLGNPDDEKIFLEIEEQEKIKSSKKKPISFDYLCSEKRDFPGLLIYLFAVCIRTPFEQNEYEDTVYKLGHGTQPTLGYSVSLPRAEYLRGKSSKEIQDIIRKTRHSYQVNKIYNEQLKLIDMAEGSEDE